jgi:hypothetical protein
LRNAHGFDERSVDRTMTAITDALTSREQLTRAQPASELRRRGIVGGGQMLMILLAHADDAQLIAGMRRTLAHDCVQRYGEYLRLKAQIILP